MEKEPTQEETLKLALDIASKTVGFDVAPSDKSLSEFLEDFVKRAFDKKAKVEADNPFVDGITVTIEHNDNL